MQSTGQALTHSVQPMHQVSSITATVSGPSMPQLVSSGSTERPVSAAGLTVLLCTHNLGQAKRLAQRVLYLEAGELRADLPCTTFFDPQATHAGAAFLRGELPWGP
jgi:ABC-type thiamine transport system ATPase subunit